MIFYVEAVGCSQSAHMPKSQRPLASHVSDVADSDLVAEPRLGEGAVQQQVILNAQPHVPLLRPGGAKASSLASAMAALELLRRERNGYRGRVGMPAQG